MLRQLACVAAQSASQPHTTTSVLSMLSFNSVFIMADTAAANAAAADPASPPLPHVLVAPFALDRYTCATTPAALHAGVLCTPPDAGTPRPGTCSAEEAAAGAVWRAMALAVLAVHSHRETTGCPSSTELPQSREDLQAFACRVARSQWLPAELEPSIDTLVLVRGSTVRSQFHTHNHPSQCCML